MSASAHFETFSCCRAIWMLCYRIVEFTARRIAMFEVRSARPGDIEGAVTALGEAFDQDPLMLYLFRENPNGVRAGAMEFFSILLRARIALGMPAYVLQQADGVPGAAMGYDTSPLSGLRRSPGNGASSNSACPALPRASRPRENLRGSSAERRSLLSGRDRRTSVPSGQGRGEGPARRLLRALPRRSTVRRRLSGYLQSRQPPILP